VIKLLGAALVLAASCAFGAGGVLRLRRHAAQLRAFRRMTDVIRAELAFRLSPVPELLEKIAETCAEPASGFARSLLGALRSLGDEPFSELWRRALLGRPQLKLTNDELEPLVSLGQTLGRYDAESQLRSLGYAETRLDGYIARAERRCRDDSRLRAVGALSVGVFIVIILI
jgi:stage III sporulation protein AB